MALERRAYGDPARYLESKQQAEANKAKRNAKKSCDGCKHREEAFGVAFCEIGQSKPGKLLTKCKKYAAK